jgi:hypothetical protein
MPALFSLYFSVMFFAPYSTFFSFLQHFQGAKNEENRAIGRKSLNSCG